MRIALDYDRTYSLDPQFWDMVITIARVFGHDIRVVTHRDIDIDRTAPLVAVEDHVDVIYTGGIAKRWFVTHFGKGFVPDVWIDDKPESILVNSDYPPEKLVEWRRERDEGPSIPWAGP